MNMNRPRFGPYRQCAKLDYVSNQAGAILSDLIAAGAKFYRYGGEEIMYLFGEVVDIYRKTELLSALKRHLGVSGLPYAKDVAISLRYQAKPFYKPIPEKVFGTVNGVAESKKIMTKYLNKPARDWIHEVIVAGLV